MCDPNVINRIGVDSNIIAAKNYLNTYYGNNSFWIKIESDYTGVELLSGIIRGFQISCGLESPTGTVGPATLAAIKSMEEIKLMDPEDEVNPFVCLAQCALFAKGYNAGGITGIYYLTGEAAVKEMQDDAGLKVTGVIDWKTWSALLSFNWFTMATSGGGDSKLRQIQRQLNADWSDFIGVQACDGIMSRNTALSLLGALQAALGIKTDYILDLNELVFGPATKAAFISQVGQLMSGDNEAKKVPFNKLAQYGLYFNGFNSYNFDGNFDYLTKTAVINFQKKHALLNLGLDAEGVIGITTMMSLMTSRGNTDRPALACDTSTILSKQQAKDLKAAGYQIVGRYLTGTVGTGPDERAKALTLAEIKNIKAAGLSVFPIYQDGGGSIKYFKQSMQGYLDAVEAISAAKRLGFTTGTTLYFAVDFDCTENEAEKYITRYFRAISDSFALPGLNSKQYKVGIYASRQVCEIVSNEGYATYAFVSDMSTGFVGNLGHPIPDNWAFDQFFELCHRDQNPFPSTPSFDIDKVAVSGKDEGCKTFDEGKELTEKEKLKGARDRYTREFLKNINSLDKFVEYSFEYDGTEIPLFTYTNNGTVVSASFRVSAQVKKPSANDYSFDVSFDEDGNYSSEMLEKINDAIKVIEDPTERKNIEELLKYFAVSAKGGNFIISMEATSINTIVIEVTGQIADLSELYGVQGSISDTLKIEVTFVKGNKYNNIEFTGLDLAAIAETSLNVLAALSYDILYEVTLYLEEYSEEILTGLLAGTMVFLLSWGWIIAI